MLMLPFNARCIDDVTVHASTYLPQLIASLAFFFVLSSRFPPSFLSSSAHFYPSHPPTSPSCASPLTSTCSSSQYQHLSHAAPSFWRVHARPACTVYNNTRAWAASLQESGMAKHVEIKVAAIGKASDMRSEQGLKMNPLGEVS